MFSHKKIIKLLVLNLLQYNANLLCCQLYEIAAQTVSYAILTFFVSNNNNFHYFKFKIYFPFPFFCIFTGPIFFIFFYAALHFSILNITVRISKQCRNKTQHPQQKTKAEQFFSFVLF